MAKLITIPSPRLILTELLHNGWVFWSQKQYSWEPALKHLLILLVLPLQSKVTFPQNWKELAFSTKWTIPKWFQPVRCNFWLFLSIRSIWHKFDLGQEYRMDHICCSLHRFVPIHPGQAHYPHSHHCVSIQAARSRVYIWTIMFIIMFTYFV